MLWIGSSVVFVVLLLTTFHLTVSAMQQHHGPKSSDDNRYFDTATAAQSNAMENDANQYHYHHHHKDNIDGSTAMAAAEAGAGGSSMNELQQPPQQHRRHRISFDKTASGNVTTLLGRTAYLNCCVKSASVGLRSKVPEVSWVRHRDINLLTVGRYTYSNDHRFRALHNSSTNDWTLKIDHVQHRDAGIYECQVSDMPHHISHYVHLNVVESVTEVLGPSELYIECGSTINLTCVIRESPEPPAFIIWTHNKMIISYESPRGGITVITRKEDSTTSNILIQNARPTDSGRYQCEPSTGESKSVLVHVLNGEFPAAIQAADCCYSSYQYLFVFLSAIVSLSRTFGWSLAKFLLYARIVT